MRILSGIQPSGRLHIGNYFGMIKPMVESQSRGELFCFIANMHSLTTVFDRAKLSQFIDDALIDMLALGISPETSTFWVQSDVPEVAELAWYLSPITPMGLLERAHSYKDKVARDIPASAGLFTYPILMAADILLYNSNKVPVGRDQKQHVEITRDIAVKFNNIYGEIFVLPEPEIRESVAVVPGTDGQKMSKSYDNAIDIFAPEKDIKKRIMSIVTDSLGVDDKKDPETNTVYKLYKLFATEVQAAELAERFRAGGMGYGEAKKALLGIVLEHFATARSEREKISADRAYVSDIRKKGALKARAVATDVMDNVRKAVGVCT